MTELPMQKGFEEAEIVTLTGNKGFTTICCWILDAGLLDVQTSEEVSIHQTRSPFAGI